MYEHQRILSAAGIADDVLTGGDLDVRTPVDGSLLGSVATVGATDVDAAVARAAAAFSTWRDVPPPRRGELVRLLGEELRAAKDDLGALVTLECGKIRQEGLGEVQEMIDICDFAVGLSRQLYGLTIASERPGHAMRETWHPLGPCAVITAFNFPVAVWAWNAALALVCGDPVIWKPSEKTPLTALADARDLRAGSSTGSATRRRTWPRWSSAMREVGEALAEHRRGADRLRHRLDPDGPGRVARPSPAVSAARSSSWAATTP